jgi:serine/threonine protein kinase
MPLAAGTRIGPYEIHALAGSGGMGEVYRARDTTLGRDVALKILPEAFAHDPERLARFRREAQLLASLNHSNIAQVHGFEEDRGIHALVMEFVEGPTLAELIGQTPEPPLDDAFDIARQVADALEAAHERGIIHRDLKPANIKLRPDGTVKVLDFGLAKALDLPNATPQDAGQSPTITTPAMTRAGLILGTAAYMSPEQARGKSVDKRADIWAFGCVVFEMLSGRRAFAGSDPTETIAAIIRGEPDWSLLPDDTPSGLVRVLRRCLTKDIDRRAADIRDVRLDIVEALESPSQPTPRTAPARAYLPWLAASLLTALAVWGVTRWFDSRASIVAPPEMRVEVTTPPTYDLVSLALSPDGEKLVFVASSDHRPKLWLRSLVTGASEALPGTDGATFPFWSPDSRSIGFFANGSLYRIDIDGGSLRPLAVAPVGDGGTWSRHGDILFTLVPDAPLSLVSAAGGAQQRLLESRAESFRGPGQRFPQFLPDGRHFLYYVAQTPVRGEYVGSLDSPERLRLFDADAAAVFVPPDRVLFVRAGKLYSQRFDVAKLQLAGNAAAIAQGVSVDAFGAAAISASATGAIAFRQGPASRQRQFAWFDRSGSQVAVVAPPDADSPLNPALSPDGRQIALNRSTEGNVDIWLLDLARRVLSRFTSDPLPEIYPVWSPNGDRLVYAKPNRAGSGFNLYQRTTAGASEEQPLLESPQNMIPEDWSRDGRYVSFITSDAAGRWDVWALPVSDTAKPIPVTKSPSNEMGSQFSPDSHWIAFESDESGRNEIYVQPFPGPGAKTIVSTGGGLQARWTKDGHELFYVAPDGRLMTVGMHVTPDGKTIEPSSPVPLFVTRISSTRTGGSRHEYVVADDGQKFLMNTFVEQNAAPITLVLNAATSKD